MCANINVLIVEDDPDINGLLYRLLQAEGFAGRLIPEPRRSCLLRSMNTTLSCWI